MWLALVACAMVPAIVAIAVLRGARDAWALFDGESAWLDAAGVALWGLAMLVVLALFGAVLRATTHHHALAGVTFAIGGVAAGAIAALFVRRLVVIAARFSSAARVVLVLGAFSALVVVVVALAIRLARESPLSPGASAIVVDLLAFIIAVTLLSKPSFARGVLARTGVPLAAGLFALGFAVLAQSTTVGAAVAERAPAFAWVAALVRPG